MDSHITYYFKKVDPTENLPQGRRDRETRTQIAHQLIKQEQGAGRLAVSGGKRGYTGDTTLKDIGLTKKDSHHAQKILRCLDGDMPSRNGQSL